MSRDKIDATVDAKLKTYQDIALAIHAKPEVSNYEFFACETLSKQLISEGFDVKVDVAGHRTGFDARYNSGKPGPVIAFLAEFDALEGIGHACGHNLFGAISCLAGVALKSVIDKTGGEVRVYGTPGEEGGENGSSKASFVREGFFKDVDAALCVHPGYNNGPTGSALAIQAVQVEFFGKSSHAAAIPEKGINALDAIIQVFNSLNAMRQHVTSDVRMHGIITDGGKAPNVIPDYSCGKFYLRAASKPGVQELYDRFENIVKGAALATGCTFKYFRYQNEVDNVIPTPSFDKIYEKHLNRYGEFFDPNPSKGSGSTDVGNVSQVIPTLHTHIRISDHYVAGHSIEMREASCSQMGLDAIGIGAKVLAHTALDLIEDEKLLASLKSEHAQAVAAQGA